MQNTTTPSSPTSLKDAFVHRLISRFDGLPSWVLLVQLFIGLGWFRAATEKFINPTW